MIDSLDEPKVKTSDFNRLSCARERLSRSRFFLPERSDDFPLHQRLQRARPEGFSPALSENVAVAPQQLRHEWDAIRNQYEHLGNLAVIDEPNLEELEARVLAFVSRFLAETEG